MTKTLRLLSLTSLLVTGVAAASLAASTESPSGNQSVTGTQTPAMGSTGTATGTTGAYGMNSQRGQGYPSVVGPTGSTQPDATNPTRTAPNSEGSGGGSSGSGSGGNSGSR